MRNSNGVFSVVRRWYERSQQRRQLRRLADDEVLLRDIGVTNYDAIREGRKPFWRD